MTLSRNQRGASGQRERTLALVLSAMLKHGPASRSELAQLLSLDRSTLTHLANTLIRAGFLVETHEEAASARGGRRPRPLGFNHEGFEILGLDIGRDFARWTRVALDGEVRSSGEFHRPVETLSRPIEWLKAIADAPEITADSGCRRIGIGVSLPGLVDHQRGFLLDSVELDLRDIDIAGMWAGQAPSVLVDNDANCSLWNAADTSSGLDHVLLCQVRTRRDETGRFLPAGAGIGLSLGLNGTILYGATGSAGELRGCGWKRGCADQLGLRLDLVEKAEGSEAAVTQLARALISNLSVVLSALDPARIVISSDSDELSCVLQEEMSSGLNQTVLGSRFDDGSVVCVPPTKYPAGRGATRMVVARLLEVPGGSSPHAAARPGWQCIMDQCRSPSPV